MQTVPPSQTPVAATPSSGITVADTGLGTLFERWALNRQLVRLQSELGFRTVLEGPGDNMTGIAGLNSLVLGLGGATSRCSCPIRNRTEMAHSVWRHHAPDAVFETVESWDGHRLPFEDGQFDLAWNFNVMTRPDDPRSSWPRWSGSAVSMCSSSVPNRLNYSFGVHRLHHRVAHEPWDHGRIDLMHPDPWKRWLGEMGLKFRETIWVDCPWWPDIVDFGQLIADFCPPLKGLSRCARPENRYRWGGDELPYYRLDDHPEIRRASRDSPTSRQPASAG